MGYNLISNSYCWNVAGTKPVIGLGCWSFCFTGTLFIWLKFCNLQFSFWGWLIVTQRSSSLLMTYLSRCPPYLSSPCCGNLPKIQGHFSVGLLMYTVTLLLLWGQSETEPISHPVQQGLPHIFSRHWQTLKLFLPLRTINFISLGTIFKQGLQSMVVVPEMWKQLCKLKLFW